MSNEILLLNENHVKWLADKFDELDSIFLDYDELVGDFDDLFKNDCYSQNLEATMRSYDNLYSRYEDILDRYLILNAELDEFFADQDYETDSTLYVD